MTQRWIKKAVAFLFSNPRPPGWQKVTILLRGPLRLIINHQSYHHISTKKSATAADDD